MLFTSYKYGLFVLGAFLLYYLAGRLSESRRPQNVLLLVASYGFYALFDWRWCFLLAGLTGTGLLGGYLLGGESGRPGAGPGSGRRPGSGRTADPGPGSGRMARRRLILAAVVAVDLLVLGVFKYLDFFAHAVASALGTSADQVTLKLVLPIGISYYIFQNLSYVIDVYRREILGRADILDYAVALSFFPQLLSGPITRPRQLLPQLAQRRLFDEARARDGLRQILWGLVKKMIIADSIAVLVNNAWANIGALDRVAVVMVAVLYSFQIYCDFSGYADIAIGTAKLFNLRLSTNFEHPYLSTSVRRFWRRWHMTLAFWMRDYVYIPLGGSRRGTARRVGNTLVTFLLVGLWHGANLTFVVWGLLHGVYLALESLIALARGGGRRATEATWEWVAEAGEGPLWRRGLSGLVVFALVTFAWIFFRAPSLAAAFDFLGQALSEPAVAAAHLRYLPWLLVGGALLVFEWFTPGWEHGFAFPRARRPVRWAVYLGACLALLLFAQFGGQQGIYVQF